MVNINLNTKLLAHNASTTGTNEVTHLTDMLHKAIIKSIPAKKKGFQINAHSTLDTPANSETQ
jgi:hypothetical protein